MKMVAVLIIMAVVFVGAAHSAEKKATNANALKEEMRLLESAYFNLLDSLILNKLNNIEEPFHSVHKAKERTRGALENGELTLPKNHDKMKHFETLDRRFHNNIAGLLALARNNDRKSVEIVTHRLLNACIECHAMFRQ